MRNVLFGFIFLASGGPCLAQGDSIVYQLLLVGDAGVHDSVETRALISRHIAPSQVASSVIFLGDNIYPKGMPDPGRKDRKLNEQIMMDQVAMASGYGSVYFLPGHYDWKQGHHDGMAAILNQQRFVDSLKNPQVRLLPRDACPGPEEIELSKDIVLVILDTQWFLHPWDKPQGETSDCESKSAADVTIHLDDVLNRNQGKRVIVAGHHPVYSYGPHGGVFTLKDHLFPLTSINSSFYLPLPIVGSIYPLYRKFIGNLQDNAHAQNKALRYGLRDVMKQYPGTVYISGHEHSLQFIQHDSLHYMVSGAGTQSAYVKQKKFSKFATSEKGFVRMLITRDGKAKVEYYTRAGKRFSVTLPKVKPLGSDSFAAGESDSLWVNTNASYQYEAGKFRTMLLGENYRAEWLQKLPLLAFDIGKERGGLQILQKGGGMETMALRLKDSVGHEYVLRTLRNIRRKRCRRPLEKHLFSR
jgi:hypothetical protein